MFDPLNVCDMSRNVIQLKYSYEEDCSICLCSMKNKKVKFVKCKHVFHIKCINSWLQYNATCPVCRSIVCDEHENDDLKEIQRDLIELLNLVDLNSLNALLFDNIDNTDNNENQ